MTFYLVLFIYLSRPRVCSVYYELIDSKFVKCLDVLVCENQFAEIYNYTLNNLTTRLTVLLTNITWFLFIYLFILVLGYYLCLSFQMRNHLTRFLVLWSLGWRQYSCPLNRDTFSIVTLRTGAEKKQRLNTDFKKHKTWHVGFPVCIKYTCTLEHSYLFL